MSANEFSHETTARGFSDTLRIALIGAGKMGRHHARAIARLAPAAKLAAVVDSSPTALNAIAELCPEAARFESVEALFSESRPDIVHVCTAPETHEAICLAAIDAGCHIYVEKPFVTSRTAAEYLISRARARGLSICVGHQLLFEPAARELFARLAALGEIVHVESYFSFRTVRRAPNGRAPLRADQQLIDILPHSVSLLLRILATTASKAPSELASIAVGPAGTVHALIRRGGLTGALVVTLEGRPIESFVRVVGTNGVLYADFVRGTVQRLIGPGTTGIDKVLAPFRTAWQLAFGSARALGARVIKRQRSYPGLAEIFESFYSSIRAKQPSPLPVSEIVDTVRICEDIACRLTAPNRESRASSGHVSGSRVLVTGGTGFLGRAVVRALLARDAAVRVLSRRLPAEWERIAGVEYVTADLADGLERAHLADISTIIHCAAETAGGRAEHERNSVAATERLLDAAAKAQVRSVVHISSLAVLAATARHESINENSALETERERCGPYVWGKLESEMLAVRRGAELGIKVKIVRPGPVVDYDRFEPPGRLGKRIGNLFVAVGPMRSRLGIVELEFAGRAIAWCALQFDEAPGVLNLLDAQPPTRSELLDRTRRMNPDLMVLWIPRSVLVPLSWAVIAIQKILRPGRPAIDVARVFRSERYDTRRAAEVSTRVERAFSRGTSIPLEYTAAPVPLHVGVEA